MSYLDKDYSFLGVEGLTGNTQVQVFNNCSSRVHYTLDEPRITRDFNQIGQMIVVSFEEWYALNNAPGGRSLITQFLRIPDKNIRKALNLPTDVEYTYDEDDIEKLIKEGTREQLEDAVEFGPYGMKEIMRKKAVDLKIDSSSRKELIGEVLGIDLDLIYDNEADEEEVQGAKKTSGRRAAPIKKAE